MKKLKLRIFFILLSVLVYSNLVFAKAEETVTWVQDNPSIAVYDYETIVEDFYYIEYLGNSSNIDLVNKDNSIDLLMFEGSFIPNTNIVIENNRAYLSLEIFSRIFDADVFYDSQGNLTISKNSNKVKFNIDNSDIEINDKRVTTDVFLKTIDSVVYIPIRLTAENLNFQVDYISDFSTSNKISGIIIESSSNINNSFNVDEGLALVKIASVETYGRLIEYFEDTNRIFDSIYKDYNPENIIYTGKDIGRYYVYELAEDLDLPRSYRILFNKYTGEIYSEKAGLPIYLIDKGFINITWLYQ